jgi:hypothetical protein
LRWFSSLPMKKKAHNPTAGSAEPSWFEWQTGLLHLVEMLDEDSKVVAVAFQLHGTKGWDDVGVRFRDGKTRLLQMKHSRIGETLTFGDLIAPGESGSPSLLRALARAWRAEHAARGTVECVLMTNRPAGPNWYEGRPPLGIFFSKIKERVNGATMIGGVSWDAEDERYPGAWEIFLAELSDLEPSERFAFLQSLELITGAPDLEELDEKLYERLNSLTGLPRSSVHILFNTLHAHLRFWTCDSRREAEWIDGEALRACLAQDESAPSWLGHCEVETPEPFFPSRIPVVETLRASLLSESSHKVDFLSAEPGAGKTSCTSKLVRSGAVRWQEQSVSIRFYAYLPIRPGQPDVGSDAAGVSPEALWLGMLWQIRDHLRKTRLLTELCVPVWLDGMPWECARGHVMRLADSLGQRWGRPFIVCIDGIDHAARARRKNLPQFLETLPAPQGIPANVRFFLAGQPAESYPEYPFFLRHPHTAVKVHPIRELADEDLRLLWRAAKPRMVVQAENAVIRLLAEKARRRTLPTVYAVEDIREAATLETAAAILNARPLPDSLHHYYDTIWSAATVTTGDSQRLAAAFALLRERPTGELMASAFSEIGKSALEWRDILRMLRPLVRENAQGFELVHNDLRVHLEARLAVDSAARGDATSALADHYRKPTSNRLAAHRSLLDLLITSEREVDFANDLTVDWIIEAGALDVDHETLSRECSAAFASAITRRDWLLLHDVACAALTFHRLHECVTKWSHDDDPLITYEVPTFVAVEGEPRPLDLWTIDDFSELVSACQHLTKHGASQRAAVVLRQWIGGIPLGTLVRVLVDAGESEEQQSNAGDAICKLFERLGRLCAVCGVPLAPPEENATLSEEIDSYLAAVETGWAEGLAEITDRRSALRLWCLRSPRYLAPWLAAIKEAAARSRWGEVRALMNRIDGCADRIERGDRHLLGWYAARANPTNLNLWFQPFTQSDCGLASGNTSLSTARIVAQWHTYTNVLREPGQVADELFPQLDLRGADSKNPAVVKLLLRASAVIGRMLRYQDRGDFEGVKIIVPPATLRPYLEALWCKEPDWRNLPHEEVGTPGEIGRILADIAWECGQPYRSLLHDLAVARFPNVITSQDGPRVFTMLWELGEQQLLRETVAAKAQAVISRLHEDDASSRNAPIANLLEFTRRLEMPELASQLSHRLGTTRIGYGCHKEWVFQPLVRWFQLLRKRSPSLWKSEGMQLLALDRIAEQQHADNRYGDELTAEVGAAAMACGPEEFEALFGFLADRDSSYPLWDLAKAAQDGFIVCLREGHTMTEESTLSRIAIAIALGRWPVESPLRTVNELLTADDVPPEIARQPAWERAVRLAAEIQGLPVSIIGDESDKSDSAEPPEKRSAEEILAGILRPDGSSWMRLREVACLAERANEEKHPKREDLIANALGALEAANAFSRCIEFHDFRLMSRLYNNLTEPERWRLLGAITAVTGEIRKELDDASWSSMVAFSAVDLACRVRAAEEGHEFALAGFHQLLGMHWKWHGVLPSLVPLNIRPTPVTWPDAARRILLLLTLTEGCEPLYMVMCGLRFFAEAFPDQIPVLCREGFSEERAADALLPLAQLWATRLPHALAPVLPDFQAAETTGTLDDRLDSWAVHALSSLVTGNHPRQFSIPQKEIAPEIVFPGDAQLFEVEGEMNGLFRHNSFARMANERLNRAGLVLGQMEGAFRYLVRSFRESDAPVPSFYLGPAKWLAFDGNYPRPSKHMENLVGEALLHQCAGKKWSPDQAAAMRMVIGYGMDPWIASATPNPWPDKEAWPSDFDVESWLKAGVPKSSDVAEKLNNLLKGADLSPDTILLGAVLRIPTFMRDIELRIWHTAPEAVKNPLMKVLSSTPFGRTLAGWLAGWSFAASKPPGMVSVQFTGALVNYPNSDLEVTPTDQWIRDWHWQPDPTNALRYRTSDGNAAAWYERWLGPDAHSRRTCRQPLLSRWVAKRECIPDEYDELREWTQRTDRQSRELSRPE